MARKRVDLTFVLDETGSMQPLLSDTIGSFNAFVEDQKKLDADIVFSLVQFSRFPGAETQRVAYQTVPLDQVQTLTPMQYRPGGSTPLWDAVGSTIDSTGRRLADMPQADRPDEVIIVILTDGEENDSHEYNGTRVKEMVEHQEQRYSWTFIFLGVGIDGFAVGQTLGVSAAYTSSQPHTAKGMTLSVNYATQRVAETVSGEVDSWPSTGSSGSIDQEP